MASILGSKLLYHITHINNLHSIIKQSSLMSHAQINQHSIDYKDIANQDVQSRRERIKIPVDPSGYLHDYVPFYFAPRSPMLYVLKIQQITQDNIIYFMTNTEIIQQHSLSYVFTDAHAIRRLTNFYTDLENLNRIDWDVMQALLWADTDDDPNRKARRQAEFLVHNEVPLSSCLGFAVNSIQTKQRVEDMLENAELSLPVAIRHQFYF